MTLNHLNVLLVIHIVRVELTLLVLKFDIFIDAVNLVVAIEFKFLLRPLHLLELVVVSVAIHMVVLKLVLQHVVVIARVTQSRRLHVTVWSPLGVEMHRLVRFNILGGVWSILRLVEAFTYSILILKLIESIFHKFPVDHRQI